MSVLKKMTYLGSVLVCVVLLGALVDSVNPASDAGLNITPTPYWSGNGIVDTFNGGMGPRSLVVYFDNTTATYYDTSNVLVTSTDTSDGIQFIDEAIAGELLIYVQATVTFGSSWSADESSPVLLDLHSNGNSFKIVPMLNLGASTTYSVYSYSYYYFATGDVFRIRLQYASADAPQFTNLFVSIVPYVG